jgi:ABC-type sugar transport system ATPase subunit
MTADARLPADGPPGGAPPSDVAVTLTGITKRFPGVVANSDINITVRRGTVHALASRR